VHPFDIDDFLARPLTVRVATNGPTVRPLWFIWEENSFWLLSGTWARLLDRVRRDPALCIVIDVCDLATGEVKQVIARGNAEILPFDTARGERMLSRYLGDDVDQWDAIFQNYLRDPQRGTVWIRLHPRVLIANDLSFSPSL